MKKNQKSIGGILYFEWLILIIDYFKSIELKERVFDVFGSASLTDTPF